MVADEWQRLGAGALLFRELSSRARAVGIRMWVASLLAENAGALRLLEEVGVERSRRYEGPGFLEVEYELLPE